MIPAYDITLDHGATEPNDALFELIAKVRPQWTKDNTTVKRLQSDGYVNAIWLCSPQQDDKTKKNDEEEEEDGQIIIRINPDPSNRILPLVVRELELQVMEVMGKKGIGQRVFARFQNGLVCSFAKGLTNLTFDKVNEPELQRQIVEQIVQIHSTPLSAVGADKKSKMDNFWYYMLKTRPPMFPSQYNDPLLQKRFEASFGSRERLMEECEFALKMFDALFDKYPLLLCHNDIWYTNMVYDEKTKILSLIDWEMAGPGILPLELGVVSEDFTDAGTSIEKQHANKRSWVESYMVAKDASALADPSRAAVDAEHAEELYKDLIRATMALRLAEGCFDVWYCEEMDTQEAKEALLGKGEKCFNSYLYYKDILQKF